MENLTQLQHLVQDQIMKANQFKKKMENQYDQLTYHPEMEANNSVQSQNSRQSNLKKSAHRSHPQTESLRVSFSSATITQLPPVNPPQQHDLQQSQSLTSLRSERSTLSPIQFNSIHSKEEELFQESNVKITIPKSAHRKRSTDASFPLSQPSTATSANSTVAKRNSIGKFKRVSVHVFRGEEGDKEPQTISAVLSPQLKADIGEAFKGIYNRRLKPLNKLNNHLQNHPPSYSDHVEYESKIRTPPEIFGGEGLLYGKTQSIADAFLEDLDMMERNLEEGFSTDLTMNAGIKELSTMATKENVNFDSLSLYIETKYIEMKEHEKLSGVHPTRIKAAVCADLLIKLSNGLPRYALIMEPLIWELINSIFFDFPRRENIFSRENFLSELLKLRGYFELYQEARDALEDISSELFIIQQGMRLKDIVKKFQTVRLAFNEQQGFIRDSCFRLWKLYWVRTRRNQKIAKRRGLRYRWNIWRVFVKRRTEREMEEYSSELDKKINRLVELNNLITTHSKEELERQNPSNRSSIVFGTASIIDPTLLPSPILTSTTDVSTISTSNPQTFEDRKKLIREISRRVSKNFETVTIATTPSIRRLIPTSSTPGGSISRDRDENEFNSFNLEPDADQLKRIERISEMVKVSGEIAEERVDQITQTPDEWMLTVNETSLLTELSISQSFAIARSGSIDFGVGYSNSRDSMDMSAGLLNGRRGSIAKYQLNSVTACQLIAYIYENRFADILADPLKGNFASTYPLLQYTKQLLIKRYSLRRLAQKFYRGLIGCCLRESVQSKRLELFGLLCGIPLADKIDSSYDTDRCTFFFRTLSIFFRKRLDQLVNTFATNEIDRAIVLALMPEIFVELKDTDVEFYQNIIYDLVDLPATDPQQIDRVYKVDFDEVLSIMMDSYEQKYRKKYYDVEERTAVTAAINLSAMFI